MFIKALKKDKTLLSLISKEANKNKKNKKQKNDFKAIRHKKKKIKIGKTNLQEDKTTAEVSTFQNIGL